VTVNYSDTLIGFLRELRQINELGFGLLISKNIKKTLNDQKKHYREAIQLKQIASFYNSLKDGVDNIIYDFQRPLLIDRIIKLETCIRKLKNDILDNPQELQAFVLKAEGLIQGFMNENEKMKRTHDKIIENFKSLYDIDLFGHKHKWTKIIDEAKSNIEKVC